MTAQHTATAHAPTASAAEITERLDALGARHAELEAQATDLRDRLQAAKRRQGRAIADHSSDAVQQECRREIRQLSDDLEGVESALHMLTADTAAASAQLGAQRAADAFAEAETKVAAALRARVALAPPLRKFAESFLAAIEARKTVEAEARMAIHHAVQTAKAAGRDVPTFADVGMVRDADEVGLYDTVTALVPLLAAYLGGRTPQHEALAHVARERARPSRQAMSSV